MFIGILGGGLSGVMLQRLLNCDSEILEKEDKVGGLCRTFCKDGFYYDIGGHILFSKDEAIMNLFKTLLAENINYCKRSNKILFKGRYLKYPFENGLGGLDREDIYDCLIGYLKNENPEPANFKEWIYYTFGNGIAEKYLVPYNEKIWKTPLEDMGLEWVERVPKPPVEDVIKSALGMETEGYVHQLYFLYPSAGGIEGFVKSALKKTSKIAAGFEVKKIRKKGEIWLVSDGKRDKYYDRLVLTLPVKEAVDFMENIPENVANAAHALKNNSVRIVLIGVNNDSLLDKSAVYIPSSGVTAHRVCYMGYFSKNNVPGGKSSLIAEITANKSQELHNISDENLVEKVIGDLHRIGIINKQEVAATDIKNLEYAYVVYDKDYRKNIGFVREYFSGIGIELHGRFAEFEYINMDEAARRSVKLAEKLNNLAEERKHVQGCV